MSRDTGSRPAAGAYLGVGVVLIAGVAILVFGRTEPVRPAGAVPTQMEVLIEQIAVANGGRILPGGCTMMGNINLGVTCKVEGLRQASLREALLKDGWQPTSGPPLASAEEHAAFVRGDDHIAFDSNRERGVVLISARKRRP